MGVLDWSPEELSGALIRDVEAALDGFREKNGQRPKITQGELADLFAAYPEKK